jgi:hypothetical protein
MAASRIPSMGPSQMPSQGANQCTNQGTQGSSASDKIEVIVSALQVYTLIKPSIRLLCGHASHRYSSAAAPPPTVFGDACGGSAGPTGVTSLSQTDARPLSQINDSHRRAIQRQHMPSRRGVHQRNSLTSIRTLVKDACLFAHRRADSRDDGFHGIHA